MRLDRLELAGFLHFTEPAVLDLRDVPHGLIAILGPNGQGKTRLLDAGLGGLYGAGAANSAFPSRDGTLAEYATSRTAYLDTLWELEGEGIFRARVNVDGQRRNTDAVLEQQLPTGLFHPLNDGKVTTFREEVARRFPSRRQVLASAFAAQGRQGSFVTLDQRQRMELFAELCDLSHYAEKHELAKRCVTAAEKARFALAAARDVLARDAGDAAIEALAASRAAVEGDLATARETELAGRTAVEDLEIQRTELTAAAEAHLADKTRVVAAERASVQLRLDLNAATAAEAKAKGDAAVETAAATRRQQATLKGIDESEAAADAAAGRTLDGLAERIKNNQGVLARGPAIRKAAAAKRTADGPLSPLVGMMVRSDRSTAQPIPRTNRTTTAARRSARQSKTSS